MDSSENYLSKVCLLKAELAALRQNNSEAKSYYQEAVSLSKKHGFLSEEAIALERYAIFNLELESQLEATELLLQSYICYKKWGANPKINQLVETYAFLKDATRDFSIEMCKSCKVFTADDSIDSVSALTSEDSSSSSRGIWKEGKRARPLTSE